MPQAIASDPPSSARGVSADPDDGGIEERAGPVDLYGEFLEESMADARPGSPDDGIDEVVVPVLGNGTRTEGKKRLDGFPLDIEPPCKPARASPEPIRVSAVDASPDTERRCARAGSRTSRC
jgi:hypothetical protein